MREPFAIILGFYLLAAPLSTRAQAQNARYVYDGEILQAVDEDFAPAKYTQWQIWLYQEGVRIPRYTVGMQYSRWGLFADCETTYSQNMDVSRGLALGWAVCSTRRMTWRAKTEGLHPVASSRRSRKRAAPSVFKSLMKAMQVNKADQGPALILAELQQFAHVTPEPLA